MKTTFTMGKVDLQKKPGFFLVEKFIGNCDIFKNSYLNDRAHRPEWIPNGAILKATCLMQSQAMTDFQDIDELNSDTIFNQIVGRRISQETLRQRLNQIALQPSVISDIDRSLVTMLRGATFNTVEINGKHYIPLDIDVTPFCNPDVQKEEISCTYKKVDGFAPIMAYLGHFALAFELRPGSQHSENGAIEFLLRCINLIKRLGLNLEDILVRVDSGHDDGDFIKVLEKNHLSYIVKRNFRRASQMMKACACTITSTRAGNLLLHLTLMGMLSSRLLNPTKTLTVISSTPCTAIWTSTAPALPTGLMFPAKWKQCGPTCLCHV